MLEQAEYLINQGFYIFPLHYKSKKPATPNGFKDATNDLEQFKILLKGKTDFNIGIKTGSGIVAIDIDPRNGGSETWAELMIDNDIPDTPCVITGGGGRHFFFKVDEKIDCKIEFLKGIDCKGDGGYVVAPPSIHPDTGKAYEWIPEAMPHEIDYQTLPDFINYKKLVKPVLQGNVLDFKTDEYLKKDSSLPVNNGCRNDTLASFAGKLISEGDKYDKVLMLCNLWNNNNKPPLSSKEVQTTVKSIFRTHRNKNPEPEVPKKLIITNEDKPNLSLDQLKVGGIIQDICEWIDSRAFKPQPILTFANVISFFSSVIGRNYRLSDDTRSNIYTLGVAPTGAGKDNSRKAIAQLGNDASLGYLFGAEDVTSGSAILTALENTAKKTVFFPFDEIGSFLTNKTGKQASSHQAEIPALFTKLFTTSNSIHFGKQFADEKSRPRTVIDQPHISIYGTGNPDQLFKSITEEMITGGFFGRMICFFPIIEYPTPNRHRSVKDAPSQVVADLYQWFLHETPPDPLKTEMQNATAHTPETVEISPEAEDVFYDFYEICEKYRANYRFNKGLDALWVRAPEIAKKFALIFTVSLARVPSNIQAITREIAQDCCRMIRTLIDRTCIECNNNVLGSDFEGVQNKIMERIRLSGAEGLTKRELSISIRTVTPQIRKQAIESLIESGLIFQEDRLVGESQKKTTFWFLRRSE